jgi:hypothetical protein
VLVSFVSLSSSPCRVVDERRRCLKNDTSFLKTMSSLDLSSSYCSSDVGVLDEPESAKHAQRSCRTGPPGYT